MQVGAGEVRTPCTLKCCVDVCHLQSSFGCTQLRHAHMLTIALVCLICQAAKVVRRERNTKCVSENLFCVSPVSSCTNCCVFQLVPCSIPAFTSHG